VMAIFVFYLNFVSALAVDDTVVKDDRSGVSSKQTMSV